jgi:hypothetical protein
MVDHEKKPVRGVMSKSQLARQEYAEAASGTITVSAHVANRIGISAQAMSAGQTVSMAEARKLAALSVVARATQKKDKKIRP